MLGKIIFILGFCLVMVGCATQTNESDVDITIGDRMFMTTVNNIHFNADEYIGKTIKLEGIFSFYEFDGMELIAVFRHSPGCCGDDGMTGFFVAWDYEYPPNYEWVEAVGVLEFFYDFGYREIRLNLLSLTVLDERGLEFVSM